MRDRMDEPRGPEPHEHRPHGGGRRVVGAIIALLVVLVVLYVLLNRAFFN